MKLSRVLWDNKYWVFQIVISNDIDLHQTEVAVHREAPEGLGGRALLNQPPQGGAGVR